MCSARFTRFTDHNVHEFNQFDDVVTEDSAACLFEKRYDGQFRYCNEHGCWLIWTGSCWKRDQTNLVADQCREIARELGGNESPGKRTGICKASFVRAMEDLARKSRTFSSEPGWKDRDPMSLGTPGGTIDLKTGRLSTAKPSDGITRTTCVTPSQFPSCPRWVAFILQVTGGDEGLTRFLKQWCGYSLTGDTSEHALVFIYGPGGNGKSVFLNVLSAVLGDYAKTAPMATFTASRQASHPTDLAMLQGARVVSGSETDQGKSWAESLIKSLTGGDPITARFMHRDFFTFVPTFKLTLVGNYKPSLSSVDEAMKRRFNIVPFLQVPEVPDPTLTEALMAELPGILRWMIEGCLDWQKHRLIRPAVVVAETASYFAAQDILGQWLDENCDFDPTDQNISAPVGDLYRDFSSFAKDAGEELISSKAFSAALKHRGCESCRWSGSRGMRGIRLRRAIDRRSLIDG